MNNYYIEVQTPTHSGWHNSGSGLPGDPFKITGRQYALAMNLDFGKRRVETYRANRCKARIVHRDGMIAVDWNEPTTVAHEDISLHNCHELVTYHNGGYELTCIFNRAVNRYFHRFRWPVTNGPEQSVSGLSPEEILQKLMSAPNLAGYLDTLRADEIFPVATAPAAPAQPTINIAVPEGWVVAGVRPGSAR